MLGLTLEDARNTAIVIVSVLVIGSFLSFWFMKTLIQKLITSAVLLVLAFAVFTQRQSLQDCADKVTGNFEREGTSVTVADTDCSFFGFTVTVRDPRTDPTEPASDTGTDG